MSTRLPSKVIVWWLLAALLASGLGLLGQVVWSDRTARLTRAYEQSASAARFLGGHVARTLESTDAVVQRMIEVMGRVPESAWSTDVAMWSELRALARALPGTDALWVLDADGRMAMITSGFPPPAVSGADHDYFLAHKRDGADRHVGPVMQASVTKGLFFTVSRAMRDADGRLRGVAVAAVDVQAFVDFQVEHGLGPSSAFLVARSDGTILLRHPRVADLATKRLQQIKVWVESSPEGTREGISPLDGVHRIVSYRTLPGWPMIVAVSAAVDDVLAPWWRTFIRSAFGGAIAVAFFCVAAGMAWRSARSERGAAAALKRSYEELERKVAERTAALERERAAAQESVGQLRFALQAAQAGTWEWDVASGAITWSEESFRLYGLQPGTVEPTYAVWHGLLHPEDRPIVDELIRLTLASGSPTFRAEFRVPLPHGRMRWLAGVGRVGYDEQGKPVRVTGLNLDITSLKQAEAAMRDAKLEAERANIAKSKFLASASHDLRQPFQAMRLFYEVLWGMLSETRTRTVAEKLNEAMRGGEELLEALLDVSTLDAGTVRLSVMPFPIADVLERVVAECEPQAQAKGLRLRYVPTQAVVVSDRVLLARMVRNLVVNAIRYTGQGSVLVGCRMWGGAIRLEVWDSGIGIPEDKQALIFEDFFQIGNDARDKSQGLGLGLSVVARMGRLLGHPIELRSKPGNGSMFALVLPKAALAEEVTKSVAAV